MNRFRNPLRQPSRREALAVGAAALASPALAESPDGAQAAADALARLFGPAAEHIRLRLEPGGALTWYEATGRAGHLTVAATRRSPWCAAPMPPCATPGRLM